MNLPLTISVVAAVLLAVFVLSGTLAGFLFCIGNVFWPMFAVLGGSSLIASWILGSD